MKAQLLASILAIALLGSHELAAETPSNKQQAAPAPQHPPAPAAPVPPAPAARVAPTQQAHPAQPPQPQVIPQQPSPRHPAQQQQAIQQQPQQARPVQAPQNGSAAPQPQHVQQPPPTQQQQVIQQRQNDLMKQFQTANQAGQPPTQSTLSAPRLQGVPQQPPTTVQQHQSELMKQFQAPAGRPVDRPDTGRVQQTAPAERNVTLEAAQRERNERTGTGRERADRGGSENEKDERSRPSRVQLEHERLARERATLLGAGTVGAGTLGVARSGRSVAPQEAGPTTPPASPSSPLTGPPDVPQASLSLLESGFQLIQKQMMIERSDPDPVEQPPSQFQSAAIVIFPTQMLVPAGDDAAERDRAELERLRRAEAQSQDLAGTEQAEPESGQSPAAGTATLAASPPATLRPDRN